MSLNPTVRWDTGFFTSMYGDFVFEHTKRGNALTHSFRIRELCVSYHMGQGNSKLLTPRGPGSRTSPCRRAPRPVEVQLSSNTSRYQQERGGGRGLRSERPLEHPSRLIRVESPRDSPVAQEPGTVRRSLCSPGEGRPCADAEDLGVEAEGGRLRRTRGEKTSKVRAPEMASSPSSFDYSVLRVRKAERWRLDGRVEELRRTAYAQTKSDAEPRHRPGLQEMPWSVSIISTAIFKSLSGQDVDSR